MFTFLRVVTSSTDLYHIRLKPNSITLASLELAPNMFGASSELAPNQLV